MPTTSPRTSPRWPARPSDTQQGAQTTLQSASELTNMASQLRDLVAQFQY